MVRDAESNADADRKRKADVETKNNADQLAFQSEKFVKENGDKIDASLKSELEGQIEKLRAAVNGTDHAAMKAESDRLQAIMQNASAQLYQRASQQQSQQAQGSPQSAQAAPDNQDNSSDAVEADYEVVK